MTLILVGIAGLLISAWLSKQFYEMARVTNRLNSSRPFGGAVPAWVSAGFLISTGCFVWGAIRYFGN